jgi:hypothetical protein
VQSEVLRKYCRYELEPNHFRITLDFIVNADESVPELLFTLHLGCERNKAYGSLRAWPFKLDVKHYVTPL